MNAQEVAPVDLSAAMDPSKAGGGLNERLRLVGGVRFPPKGVVETRFGTVELVVVDLFFSKAL